MTERGRLEEVAAHIRQRISMQTFEEFSEATCVKAEDFLPLPMKEFSKRTFAVDGSNSLVCDWTVVQANHIRAGYVVYRGRDWQRTVVTFDSLFLADRKSYTSEFLRYLKGIFGQRHFTLSETELDRLTTYFRELQEYAALWAALNESEAGDLLLYDGGFALWKGRPFGPVLEYLFNLARDRDVDMVGISKSSSMSWGDDISRPFVQHAARLGDRTWPGLPWYMDLTGKKVEPNPEEGRWNGRIYLARFSPAADRAFRVDAPEYLHPRIDDVMANISAFSGSAESAGYPHALFRAHHEMKISRSETEQMRLRLLDALGATGLGEREVRRSMDYHETLEKGRR
ncbi:MAG: NurA domain protein [Methanosaeta sp. PtaB.Bin039]|mgnify:CR=1 FL=1|nr:MAG: NurA domain protein [Methanosaeta sp. PtaB.Bin039]OPY46088.1 MAG: NurA domain protein [Methanosaeta sp. PtaU1.Bin028]HOT06035.1 DNA double-strand break repair nuclease NurA [Methanotrichaceae archaeon]HQF16315.1 DNA double-strand break repair nuclease NurA [Methanotrichaceae archaeon]HQI90087.1 DNA double-strand break repair nuclease NurA [Methanotrichaceae archaeon]